MAKRAALILAGGKAQRFQTEKQNWHDKALAELSGKPLLVHTIGNVQSVVEEVFVCVNDDSRKNRYRKVLVKHGFEHVQLVTDERIDGLAGPIIGILSGLKATNADYCLTLPADMPLLKTQVADYMFNQAQDYNVVIPMWPNGQLETLTTVLKRAEILTVTETLCKLHRSRPMDIVRAALKILFVSPLAEIQTFDPEMKSFVNINCPQDLTRLQARQTEGPVKKNVKLNLGELLTDELRRLAEASSLTRIDPFNSAKKIEEYGKMFEAKEMFFWSALSKETQAKILLTLKRADSTDDNAAMGKSAIIAAAENYGCEAEIYNQSQCALLAERAKADQAWCQSKAAQA